MFSFSEEMLVREVMGLDFAPRALIRLLVITEENAGEGAQE